MELELSLGTSLPARSLRKSFAVGSGGGGPNTGLKLGFFRVEDEKGALEVRREGELEEVRTGSFDPPAQLNVLLHPHHPPGLSRETEITSVEVLSSSPACSNQLNFSGGDAGDVGGAAAEERSSDEENGGTRKKLRLSKEQSAFLEESFREHSTLKPKQKCALAKQLNLRPRQVEVWFQNRRARTKLKQTEVDCEYLKRCCEALTEENRRLQKELSELRTLKASPSVYTQLPATTLSMCAACDRASKSNVGGGRGGATTSDKSGPFTALFGKPRFHGFANPPSAAS